MNMLKMADGVFAHDRRVYDRWGETDPAIKAALADYQKKAVGTLTDAK